MERSLGAVVVGVAGVEPRGLCDCVEREIERREHSSV